MNLNLHALVKGLAIYWVLSIPLYAQWGNALPQLFAETISWSPYIAAFVTGIAYSYFHPTNQDKDCILLGIFIGLSVGLLNFLGPLTGLFQSDLPGFYYSSIIAIIAVVISIFLVLAGAGARNLINASK